MNSRTPGTDRREAPPPEERIVGARSSLMKSAALFVFAMLVTGAAAPPAATPQRAPAAPTTIPFELANRHIIVKARVNNSRPLSFVLDTGATAAIVRMDVAKELGLALGGSVNARGAGPGTQAGAQVKNARWSLVGLEAVAQPVAFALPMPELPSALGGDADGIIGGQFIRQFVMELDYQSRRIRLHDPAAFAYSGPGETLPLEFNSNGHPTLKATVTPQDRPPIERQFLLDIGSGLALALHSPFVAEHELLASTAKTVRAIGAGGAGGRTDGRLGRVAALQIGSFRFANPITLFSQDKAGAFADAALAGNIGAQIVSRFRTFFDYGRRRIILEPSPTYSEPFDRAFSGISLRAEGQDYRTFRVRDVLEDSPATEAGIAAGDVITSIDAVPAASLTLTAIGELLEKPVARALEIRRAERILKIMLTPKPFI
jgi:hypothetical protein